LSALGLSALVDDTMSSTSSSSDSTEFQFPSLMPPTRHKHATQVVSDSKTAKFFQRQPNTFVRQSSNTPRPPIPRICIKTTNSLAWTQTIPTHTAPTKQNSLAPSRSITMQVIIKHIASCHLANENSIISTTFQCALYENISKSQTP